MHQEAQERRPDRIEAPTPGPSGLCGEGLERLIRRRVKDALQDQACLTRPAFGEGLDFVKVPPNRGLDGATKASIGAEASSFFLLSRAESSTELDLFAVRGEAGVWFRAGRGQKSDPIVLNGVPRLRGEHWHGLEPAVVGVTVLFLNG